MAKKYIDADRLKAEIDKRYAEYLAKMKKDDFTYYEGMADALDLFEQFIDSLQQEQPYVSLEKEYEEYVDKDPVFGKLINHFAGIIVARHFYELGKKSK